MNTCMCGNATEAGCTRCPRCAALHALDLDVDATEAEIRRAYHLLVKVWHPDRFQTDQKLRDAAEQKLKDVNSAYEFLTSTSTERGAWRPPSRPAADPPSHEPPAAEPAPAQSGTSETTSDLKPLLTPRRRLWPIAALLLKVAAVAIVLLFARYLWIAFDVPDPTGGQLAKVYGFGKESLLDGLKEPKQRFIEAVEHDLERLGLRKPAEPPIPQPAPQIDAGQHPQKTPSAPRKVLPYITVGSTRDEVLAWQGNPTASSEDKLVYGKSELYLKNGAVTGWRIDPVSSPIRVKLWPAAAVDTTLASYTYGSSKDVVLVVQGTPTAFTEDKFEYGRSEVNFRNNRVVSWKEDPDSTPLWAR
jgi:hypothetical protein